MGFGWNKFGVGLCWFMLVYFFFLWLACCVNILILESPLNTYKIAITTTAIGSSPYGAVCLNIKPTETSSFTVLLMKSDGTGVATSGVPDIAKGLYLDRIGTINTLVYAQDFGENFGLTLGDILAFQKDLARYLIPLNNGLYDINVLAYIKQVRILDYMRGKEFFFNSVSSTGARTVPLTLVSYNNSLVIVSKTNTLMKIL